jgi:hypothetical protein
MRVDFRMSATLLKIYLFAYMQDNRMEKGSNCFLGDNLFSFGINYVDKPLIEDEMEGLRRSVNRQAPYGESAWQRMVCAALGLESTMRRRGRPGKSEKEQEK